MRKNERTSSLSAITLLLGILVFGVWLLGMAYVTVGTAQYVFAEVAEDGYDLARYASAVSRLDDLFGDDENAANRRAQPGIIENYMQDTIARGKVDVSSPYLEHYSGANGDGIYREAWEETQTALLFLDKEGNIVQQSGDFVFFPYVTEERWQAGEDEGQPSGYGWLDVSDRSDSPGSRYGFLHAKYNGVHSLYDYRAMRLTGTFDGSRFEPYAMAIMDDWAVSSALDQTEPDYHIVRPDGSEEIHYTYTLSGLDAQGLIEWEARFDRTDEAPAGQELVTIYALSPEMFLYEPDGEVRHQGKSYEDLLALLRERGYYLGSGGQLRAGTSELSLRNMVVFDYGWFYDLSDYRAGEDYPNAEYTLVTAMQASPLKIAMSFLRNVYWFTFVIVLVAFLMVRKRIKKGLTDPLREIDEGMKDGWTLLSDWGEDVTWQEPYDLRENYVKTRTDLRRQKDEITRLNTALDYAKAAEENRRQMTSNIAHELKTPLAVVHSYAEGLKEKIAEEKRDRYLDVILSETERMDGMVLEMLDLSRLEAGRVKLAQDEFSLEELARATFEKLEMAIQGKNLQVKYTVPKNSVVTADQARIGQVVENFASNAVKYTPVGGRIWVNISVRFGKMTFAVENDSEHMAPEVLLKVWDTFYRVDESRSSPGTGLGLAIAKNIIELHGGTCSAYNTNTGVGFSFTI